VVHKAIEDSPCALEIFDVARVLASLFGVGDGRVVFRATADAIGAKRIRVPDQGGSRKVIALVQTVDHLLKNLKTFHAAMHARIGQAEGANRRGGQTKGALINVGRRVSALNFVVFTTAVRDLLRKRISPLAHKAQQVNIGAWAMDNACHTALDEIRKDTCQLAHIRRWCFITCMLHTYVRAPDLRFMWMALLISPLGRAFPQLVGNLHHMMLKQIMSGVRLSVELPAGSDVGGVQFHTLSPRCQCPSMRTRPCAGIARRARVSLGPGAAGVMGGAPSLISVPEWVAYSAFSRRELSASMPFLVPRFVRVQQEAGPPLALQGVSRYRQSAGVYRCVVPDILMFASFSVLEGLFEAECFFQRLMYYFEGYVIGSIGVNKSMRNMYEHLKTCWDFS
jgi:hypothetical protein